MDARRLAQRDPYGASPRRLTELERQIVIRLQANGRATSSAIGRALGIPSRQVGRTINRLADESAIVITAVPFPPMLGYRSMAIGLLRTTGERDRADVARELSRLDEVDYVAVMTGPEDIMINVLCRDLVHLDEVIDRDVARVKGARLAEVAPYIAFRFQRPSRTGPASDLVEPVSVEAIKLDELDRAIVRALAEDGRRTNLRLAAELAVSEGQIRLRLNRLTANGALRIMAIVDPIVMGFDVISFVKISHVGGDTDRIAETLTELEQVTWLAETAGSFSMFVEVACVDERELRSTLNAIRGVAGITAVVPHVYLDLHYKPMNLG